MGNFFESPFRAASDNWDVAPTEADLPKLKRASDILTAFWLRGHTDPKNLRYYLVCQGQNAETTALIARILKNANIDKIPRWPGYTVHMSDEAGEALLGKQMSQQNLPYAPITANNPRVAVGRHSCVPFRAT